MLAEPIPVSCLKNAYTNTAFTLFSSWHCNTVSTTDNALFLCLEFDFNHFFKPSSNFALSVTTGAAPLASVFTTKSPPASDVDYKIVRVVDTKIKFRF